MAKKRSARRGLSDFSADNIEDGSMVDKAKESNTSPAEIHKIETPNEAHGISDEHGSITHGPGFLHMKTKNKYHVAVLTPPNSDVQHDTMVSLPHALKPNFRLLWGDDNRDQIETDDVENIIIEASNPYTNVVIKDLTIVSIELFNPDKNPPALLPDETPSVSITPSSMIRLGDINVHSVSSEPACQEFVFLSRGAKRGEYEIRLHFTFSIELNESGSQGFIVELIPS